MKKIFLFYLFLGVPFCLKAQETVEKDNIDFIYSKEIKSISIYFKSIYDLPHFDSLEVKRLDFKPNGQLIFEKEYHLFDIKVYSIETKYIYNDKDYLVEQIETNKSYYNNDFENGSVSSSKKWIYKYDELGNRIKEIEYKWGQSYVTEFKYDGVNSLIEASFRNPNDPNAAENRIEEYSYDKEDRLIKTIARWKSGEVRWTKRYVYDGLGNLISESQEHPAGAGRTSQTKYEYQKNQLISSAECYSKASNVCSRVTYEYAGNGCIQKKEFVRTNGSKFFRTYKYFDCTLIKSEYWYDKEGKTAFYFESDYCFYD